MLSSHIGQVFQCLTFVLYKETLQWNAEIRTSEIRTMPKSEQTCVWFPDVRISDVRDFDLNQNFFPLS